jgi:hypothetical protein
MSDLQMSRGAVFALCLSQAAITIGVIFYYPPIHVETYTCQPAVANGTLVQGFLSPVKSTTTSLVIPFMALSCLGALFATTSAGLIEKGILVQNSPYTYDVLMETGFWDLMFWAFCALAHALVLLVALSPVDIYAINLSGLLIIYFLCRACQPRNGQGVSVTQENTNILGFFAGLLIAFYSIPDTHSGRPAALAVMVLLDYILGVGHTWESMPPMDTVTNCRLFWTCSVSFCMAGLYGAWHDHLLIERVN